MKGSSALIARFKKRTLAPDERGCTLWPSQRDSGYGKFYIGEKPYRAHRIAWQVFNGPIPDGLLVCHKCDVRNCVNIDHLFLGTHKDNSDDKVRKNRQSRDTSHLKNIVRSGEHASKAKLSEKDAIAIRERRLAGAKLIELATEYGVARSSISSLVRADTWPHLGPPISAPRTKRSPYKHTKKRGAP